MEKKPQPAPKPQPDQATITPYENRIGNAMGSMRPREGRGRMAVLALALGLLSIGCHAQMPPTVHSVDLTYQAPVPVTGGIWQIPCGTATGQSPCTYVMSRITVANGTPGCPLPSATAVYTPLNSSAPATGLSYTDSGVSGITACYVVQAIQLGTTGGPSNVAGPLVVPANPGAPTLSNGTVAELEQPALPPTTNSQVASEQTPVLRGHVR